MIRTTAAGALIALVTLSATPAYADATGDVRAAMLRFAGLSSYEMTFVTGAHGGTMDFVKPNSLHMTSGPFEMIRIGTTTYMKQGPRGWMKIHDTPGAVPADFGNKIRDLANKPNAVSATDLGMKNVDGEALHAYRVTSDGGSPTTVYIGRDGLPHRFQSSGGSGENVVKIGKFNAVAPIRAPI
ncbi:MAG TPA: hypothetical protein VGX96_06340 [Candidatus Elarobacter sp.]|jgi:hypothetical protein|nr:hypothetical protein [Candidatus Elarobacter sp.]